MEGKKLLRWIELAANTWGRFIRELKNLFISLNFMGRIGAHFEIYFAVNATQI